MKNSTGEKASIEFYIKEDSIHASPLYLSSSKEVVFDLPEKGKNRTIKLSCGEGSWSPAKITALTDDLDSIIIRKTNSMVKLVNQEEQVKYLIERRKGLDRGRIVLDVQ